jgi:hypothetical protein
MLRIGRTDKDSEEITLVGLQKHPCLLQFVIPCLSTTKSPKTRVRPLTTAREGEELRGEGDEEGTHHGGSLEGGAVAGR